MDRREFLRSTAFASGAFLSGGVSSAGTSGVPTVPPSLPLLDTHIHLFDPTRPGGVPWPEPSDTVLYRPALPDRYERLASSSGVVGAIAIEASPLSSDNDWLLGVAEKFPLIVGIVGDLIPDSPEFRAEIMRLRANPLFLGIRYGNLWGRDLADDVKRPGFMDGLKLLSAAGLVFESANPTPALLNTLAEIAERLPELTIVVDHLPHAAVPSDAAGRANYTHSLRRLGDANHVFIKLSEIPKNVNGRISTLVAPYRETLDELWQTFREESLLFGSDWPNSDHLLPFRETVSILKTYASDKSRMAQENLFWRNSILAYKWRPRLPNQPC